MTTEQLALYTYAVSESEVCLLLTMGPYKILLDCGLTDISLLTESNVPPADLVICSHAHSDHSRGLFALHQAFPNLPIYASEITTQLLPLNWLNFPNFKPFFQALSWRSPVEFAEGLCAELFPAGHLPGASAIYLTLDTPERCYSVLYTGDFFLSNSRLVEGLSLEDLRGLKPDVLILEGSYGTARYPHRKQQENQVVDKIFTAINQGYSILLPVPSMGIGQELLILLRSHHLFTGKEIDIWVDENIALACDTYLQLLSYFPTSVQNFARNQPLFWDERIRPRVQRLTLESLENLGLFPTIVMIDKNSDFRNYLTKGKWLVLLPDKHDQKIIINNMDFPNVDTYLLSEHSDGLGTTQLIHNLRPQHVIFIHGTNNYLSDLTGLEELQNRYQLHCPPAEILLELPVGEVFLQPIAPNQVNYQGDVTEFNEFVSVNLPHFITNDSRWNKFTETGFIVARWQGEELVLRGISQRELIQQANEAKLNPDIKCCGNCLFQRGQKCVNNQSPLYGFKVSYDGVCPYFRKYD